nr:YdcF family protein [Phenylobacterium sp. SCN 70-31]
MIFGAAVRADGSPSPALARRIRYGAAAAAAFPASRVLCSGGPGPRGPSEAAVMADQLSRRGVASARLLMDEASLDTLQNVAAAARAARAEGAPLVVACSDAYHLPRIRLLLTVLGVRSRAGPQPGSRGDAGHRVAMALREAVAIPYDLVLAAMHRRRLLS